MSNLGGVAAGSLPMRLFTRGTEPIFDKSFTYHSGLENLPVLSNEIPMEELDQIRNGPLGVILRFYEDGFMWSAKLVHQLLVNQLVTKKKYEFWTLCGGQAMRFSLKEFRTITGLNCDAYPVEDVNVEDDPEFWKRIGLVENKEPSYKLIEEQIRNCKDWDTKDRIRLVYLFLVVRFLLAIHPGSGITQKSAFLVVDREKFETYPWGRVAFQHLIDSVSKAKPDLCGKSYTVNGFVQVLQVWAYEAIPVIGKKCGNPRENRMEFPPLLRWNGSRNRCKYDLPQNREPVLVNSILDNNPANEWDDEEQDVTVDYMLSLISGSSGKVFEKHFWEEKGVKDGSRKMVEKEDDETQNGEDMPLKRKQNSKMKVDNNNEALKTYFTFSMEQMAEKIQKHISTYVDDAVKKIVSRMEKIEEGIKGILETKENIDTRMNKLETEIKGVEESRLAKEKWFPKETTCSSKPVGKGELEPSLMKEKWSPEETTCSNEPSGKRSKPLSKYELKDISVDDLSPEEDTVECSMDSEEKVESADKTLSETSSTRVRNMSKRMVEFTKQIKASIIKKPTQKEKSGKPSQREKSGKPSQREKSGPIATVNSAKPTAKEKRSKKPTAPLKSPFVNKIIMKDRPLTAYDPFKQVEETSVAALDEWMSRNVRVPCGNASQQIGRNFFIELMTPQLHISNAHIDAGMALFRRRSLMSPCPYRGGRMAFMDSGFTVAIGNRYKEFEKDPKNYKWKSGADSYYSGVFPRIGCTNKQFGKDVDDIYVVIHIKGNHWAALAISVPNRTIHVFDSILGYTSEEEMVEYVKPYARMIPHMLKAFASEKKGLSVAQYKITRRIRLPQNIQTGDCGVYAIKYIECLALGCDFKGLCDENIESIRAKLAAEIFVESNNGCFY